MPRKRPDDGDASPSPLPTSLRALEKQFHSAPNEDDRTAIIDAIRADFPGYRKIKQRRRSGPNNAASRLFEQRVLVCIRRPIIDRSRFLPPTIVYSQLYAWRDLIGLSSAAFVPQLGKFLKASTLVRNEAIQHLAWTGFDRVIPDVTKFLSSRDPAIVEESSRGAGLAAFNNAASTRFRRACFDALAPALTGEPRPGPVPRIQQGAVRRRRGRPAP